MTNSKNSKTGPGSLLPDASDRVFYCHSCLYVDAKFDPEVPTDSVSSDDCESPKQTEPECNSKMRSKPGKSKRLTTDQLTELIAIDKRVGLRGQLQRFIHALNSGGQTLGATDEDTSIDYHCNAWEVERQRQAKVLWDKGVGRALGFTSFRKYLHGIPPIPELFCREYERFNHVVLVDGRIGLQVLCRLAGVLYHGSEFRQKGEIYWILCQDGRAIREVSAMQASVSFGRYEAGMSVFEGVCLYMQVPQVLIRGHMMLFTEPPNMGSLAGDVATLQIAEMGPEISWSFGDKPKHYQGTASKLRL